MKSTEVDVDEIMRALDYTKYFHISQYILISAAVLIASTNSFFYMFFALTPEFTCKNLTDAQLNQYNISINEVILQYDKCSIDIIEIDGDVSPGNRTLDCVNGYSYTTPINYSIVSQWDLVCNRLGLAESTQTLYSFGQVVSGLLSPLLIEKFGRKALRVSSHFILLIFNMVAAYTPYYWLFITARFFLGVAREAFILSSVALICELYPQERRVFASGSFMFVWGLYNITMGLITYLLKDYGWRSLLLFSGVLSGYCIIDIFFLEESVRWLFANSKIKEAKKILKRAAKQNNVNFEEVWSVTFAGAPKDCDGDTKEDNLEIPSSEPQVANKSTVDSNQPQIEEVSLRDNLVALFKSPYLRMITIITTIEWAIGTASLLSTLLMIEVLSGSIYQNISVMSSFESISVFLHTIMAKIFGHKISLLVWKVLITVCLLTTSAIKMFTDKNKESAIGMLLLYSLALAGMVATCSGDYMYTSELYPTQIRSVGCGVATTFTRIVAMAAPFMKLLALAMPWFPGIIIGIGCIVSGMLLQIFLPETGNLILPQTLEDMKTWEKKDTKANIEAKE
ncbi:solute carrier family 22 member 8-like [Argonauta hians]